MLTKRQTEIINAAMDIVVNQGTHKLTIRNVASAIGVSEPAVYRHFASKHDLLVVLLQTLQESIVPIFSQAETQSTKFTEFTHDFLMTLFSHIEENPAFALFVFTEEAFHTDEELRPLLSHMLDTMVDKITQLVTRFQNNGTCREDISAAESARIILGAIRLHVTQWHLHHTESLTEQARPLADIINRLLTT
jgi:AcrR family transcriptional regulator